MTMNREKLEHHLASLKEVHAVLDKDIDDAIRSGKFKDEELELLKKRRLKIKDDMEGIKRRMESI